MVYFEQKWRPPSHLHFPWSETRKLGELWVERVNAKGEKQRNFFQISTSRKIWKRANPIQSNSSGSFPRINVRRGNIINPFIYLFMYACKQWIRVRECVCVCVRFLKPKTESQALSFVCHWIQLLSHTYTPLLPIQNFSCLFPSAAHCILIMCAPLATLLLLLN